jgi:glutamate racemase
VKTLGIFDSGLGGIGVLRSVRARLPGVDVVYLADQAHVPYGDRAAAELRVLLAANVATLEAAGVDAIVMGCNTSCAIAARFGWPPASVPILDLIEAAAGAVAASGARRVGVIATAATARAGAYGAAIRRLAPHAEVEEVGAPALVPLVEAGIIAGPRARGAVADACAALLVRPEAVVLACTHYPFLAAEFAAVLGAGVALIDPAEAQGARAAVLAPPEASAARARGRTRYISTGDLAAFQAGLLALGEPLGERDTIEAGGPSAILR